MLSHCIGKHNNREMLGTREIIAEEKETQPDGKVNYWLDSWLREAEKKFFLDGKGGRGKGLVTKKKKHFLKL